jgi:hypothetical protein
MYFSLHNTPGRVARGSTRISLEQSPAAEGVAFLSAKDSPIVFWF